MKKRKRQRDREKGAESVCDRENVVKIQRKTERVVPLGRRRSETRRREHRQQQQTEEEKHNLENTSTEKQRKQSREAGLFFRLPTLTHPMPISILYCPCIFTLLSSLSLTLPSLLTHAYCLQA